MNERKIRMEPTEKSKGVDELIDDMFDVDRKGIIEANQCAFCKKEVTDFRDEISIREYRISGMCQACQDEVFGTEYQIGIRSIYRRLKAQLATKL